MPGVVSQSSTRPRRPPTARRFSLFATAAVSLLLGTSWSQSAQAEVRIVTAQGEHRMGDRDTREEAVRLATEAAKRNALEQVATYLESVTVVTDLDVTKDEIRTYTAGVVLVLDQQETTALEGNTIIVRVDMTAQIDTEEVVQAIAGLRENLDARQELVALKQEVDQLHQELDAANQALAQATTAEQIEAASRQREEILNRVQSNHMVSQAWTDWVLVSPVINPSPWVGVAQVQALLNVANRLNPNNPHINTVQQAMAARPVPSAPRPPTPPAPNSAQPRMPTYQVVPQYPTAARPTPPTLNEIHQAPPSRRPTDLRQLEPFSPFGPRTTPRAGLPSNPTDGAQSRALQALSPTFRLTPPASTPPSTQTPRAVPPAAGRRLPPTINQVHPPMPHQVPRVPYQLAPRTQGGGGQGGGVGGRGGGGRGGKR